MVSLKKPHTLNFVYFSVKHLAFHYGIRNQTEEAKAIRDTFMAELKDIGAEMSPVSQVSSAPHRVQVSSKTEVTTRKYLNQPPESHF
jgi:hypothetical protein